MKYYLHDTSAIEDEKVAELFKEFGYEGVGLFYVILEKIGKQEKPIKTDVLQFQLKVGKKLKKCWNFMENIGLISSNNGETFNKQLLNFSESYQIKKEKTRKKVEEWRKNQTDKENVTGYETVSNQPKVKGSKVNKRKENSVFDNCLKIYIDFIKEKTGVIIEKLNKSETTALSSLIAKISELEEFRVEKLKLFFETFDKWSKFHQGRLKAIQLNSDYLNIMSEIKNSIQTKQSENPIGADLKNIDYSTSKKL